MKLLPNRYKIIEIPCSIDIHEKEEIATQFIVRYCGIQPRTIKQYTVCNLTRKWWQFSLTLHFYYDKERFAISLWGEGANAGWVDFGQTEKQRKILVENLESLMISRSATIHIPNN